MIKTTLIIVFLALFNNLYSQTESYQVLNLGDKYTLSEIQEAFSTANLCGYFYESKKHILTFDDGTEVALDSKADNTDVVIDVNCFKPNSFKFSKQVWMIGNKKLIISIQTVNSKTK